MTPGFAAVGRPALLALVLLALSGCATSEAEFWYNRGVRAHQSLDSRISHFTKAIELQPDYAWAFYNRGVAYKNKRRYGRAIADYSEAIRLFEKAGDEPQSVLAFAHNDRGIAYYFNRQYDRAMGDYGEAIRLKPDYATAFYNRGLAYKVKGQYDRAIRDYTEAIRLKPDYAFAYTNRGNAYSMKGVYDRAIEDKNTAIALLEGTGDKPNLAIVYSSRGASYRKMGAYGRAMADAGRAIELKPDYADAYGHLAWRLATAPDAVHRNGKRAGELAETAIKLDRDAHNLDTLAAAYAEAGRFADAVSTQLQAIDLPQKAGDEIPAANLRRRLERYRGRKPWRMTPPAGGSAEAAPRKRESQQKLEALSGRYVTAGGRSTWDISFRDNRFTAHYLSKGKRSLLYDGAVIATRIVGRKLYYRRSLCRKSQTTPLYGHVDPVLKSFEVAWADYDLVQMRRHKKCVPITFRRTWTQADRQ